MMKKIETAGLHGAVAFIAIFAVLMAFYEIKQHWLLLPEWVNTVLLMWGFAVLAGLAATLLSEKRLGWHTFPRRSAFFGAVAVLLGVFIVVSFFVKGPDSIQDSPWKPALMCWIVSAYAWFSIAVYLSICHLLEWLIGWLPKRGDKNPCSEAVPFRFRPLWVWLVSIPFFLAWYWLWMGDL